MSPSVVIVAMAVDAVNDHAALTELADVTGASVAYLQRGEPALTDELSRLAEDGATRVRLVRLPAAGAAPARSWLRRVAAHWVREHPGTEVEVVASAVTGREAPLRSAAWEDVPGFRHHVLVCRGPRCSALDSAATTRALDAALNERGLGDDDVLITQTGCLFPCNHAPVVAVHPDDVWYGPVTESDAGAIVDEHLIAGHPVDRLRRPRTIAERTTS